VLQALTFGSQNPLELPCVTRAALLGHEDAAVQNKILLTWNAAKGAALPLAEVLK
jgi:hypothetical protein